MGLDDFSPEIESSEWVWKSSEAISEVSERKREIKKHHLRVLGLALIDIKNYNENIYKTYLKRIVNNKDISIHGHIFEI